MNKAKQLAALRAENARITDTVERLCDCMLSDLWKEGRKRWGLPPKPVPAKYLKRLKPEELA